MNRPRSNPANPAHIMKKTIKDQDWILFRTLKICTLTRHIAFLKVCRREGLIPRGLVCRDILRSTFASRESKELAHRHSLQYLNLLIDTLYKRLRWTSKNGYIGPLTQDDTFILMRFNFTQITMKVKKLTDLKMKALLNVCDSLHMEVSAFKNLSDQVFTEKELGSFEQRSPFCSTTWTLKQGSIGDC